jgi:translation initiation factor 2A
MGVVDKLKVEGATTVSLSPGLNPSIAVFTAEKKVGSCFCVSEYPE